MGQEPTFYTVAEVAELLRVDVATVYRAIRDNAFPAVRIRSRYTIPAAAIEEMVREVSDTGGCMDLASRVREARLGVELGNQQRFRRA